MQREEAFKEGFKPPEARTFFNAFIKDSYYKRLSITKERFPRAPKKFPLPKQGELNISVRYAITRRASSFSQVCRTWQRQKPQP